MPNVCSLSAPFIPLASDEPLWEWYLPTDSLFFSDGAKKALKLDKAPDSMTEFYKLLPADTAIELASSREGALSGKQLSISQCSYLLNGLWLQENFIVLTRDSRNRATRVMGRMEVSQMEPQNGFFHDQALFFSAGLWMYDVSAGKVWRDALCETILGYDNRGELPVSHADTLFDVHPSEREALKRHYELFCSGNFLGHTITDIVRVRHASGSFFQVLVRATALRRDENGRAELILGIMAPGEPQLAMKHTRKKNDRIFKALQNMGSGQWNWDTKKDNIYFYPRYLEMLGYSAEHEEEFAKNWRERIHPDDRAKVEQVHERIIRSPEHGDTYECTYRMRRADDDWAWLFDQGCVTWRDTDGFAAHLIGSITNITTAQEEREKLEELVRHDALTGLRSRSFCNLEIEHIERNSIRPVSIISIDVTGLKMINDYLGHAQGDELLRNAASIMRNALRRSDCVGRIGGDEFIIILPGCDKRKGAKVLAKLAEAFKSHNREHPDRPIFAALGLASADSAATSMQEVMKRADEEMYENKKAHRKDAHHILKTLIFQATGKQVGPDNRLAD